MHKTVFVCYWQIANQNGSGVRRCSHPAARCRQAKDAARQKETAASSASFCSDPKKSLQHFAQAVKNMAKTRLTREQHQQMQKFRKVHNYVVQADA